MAASDWISSIGEIAKQVILNTPFGVGVGGAHAPRFTIGSVVQPYLDQKNREEGMTQLKAMGLFGDDVDIKQMAKMDPATLHMAFNLLGKQGHEAKLGDVPGGVQAFFPGVEPPQPTKEYGVMAPEVGEGPTLNQIPPSMEDQARYQQVAGITMPRPQIYKKLGEMQGQKASAGTLRKLYPEYADQVSEQLSVPELVTLRQAFGKQRADTHKETVEADRRQRLAAQVSQLSGGKIPPSMVELDPNMATTMLGGILSGERQDKSLEAMSARQDKSLAAMGERLGKHLGQGMAQWQAKADYMDELRRKGADQKEISALEKEMVQGLRGDIKSAKDRLANYETMGSLMPGDTLSARVAETQLEIKQMEQKLGQVTTGRIKKSPLLSSTGKGGAAEFEDLFK